MQTVKERAGQSGHVLAMGLPAAALVGKAADRVQAVLPLARSPGRVFSRTMLLERLWGDAAYRDPRTIDVHIRHLREKIERDAKEPELIFTVRGVGYHFRDR